MGKAENLYEEHRRMVEVLHSRGLTKSERKRLTSITNKLDEIESAQIGRGFRRIQRQIEDHRKAFEKMRPLVDFTREVTAFAVDKISQKISMDELESALALDTTKIPTLGIERFNYALPLSEEDVDRLSKPKKHSKRVARLIKKIRSRHK